MPVESSRRIDAHGLVRPEVFTLARSASGVAGNFPALKVYSDHFGLGSSLDDVIQQRTPRANLETAVSLLHAVVGLDTEWLGAMDVYFAADPESNPRLLRQVTPTDGLVVSAITWDLHIPFAQSFINTAPTSGLQLTRSVIRDWVSAESLRLAAALTQEPGATTDHSSNGD